MDVLAFGGEGKRGTGGEGRRKRWGLERAAVWCCSHFHTNSCRRLFPPSTASPARRLRDNQISEKGAELLADALKVNSTLKGLSIYGNQLKFANARKLQRRIFKHNTVVDFTVKNPLMLQ